MVPAKIIVEEHKQNKFQWNTILNVLPKISQSNNHMHEQSYDHNHEATRTLLIALRWFYKTKLLNDFFFF